MKRGQLQLLGFEHTYYTSLQPRAAHAIVALHGYGNSGRAFRYLTPFLEAANISLYAPDLLGFGNSAKPEGGYSLLRYARLNTAFVEKLGLEKPWLMGHSFGGILALATAVLHPEAFAGLILISPGGFHPLTKFQVLADRKFAYKLMRRPVFKRILLASPLGTVFEQEATFETLLKMYGSHQDLDLDLTGIRKKIAALSLPTLLCWGADDRILPRFVWERARKQLPNAQFELIPNAGHALTKDQPVELVKRISTFIDQEKRS